MSAAQDEFNELIRDKDRRTGHPEDDDEIDGRSFLNLSDSEDGNTEPAVHGDVEEPFASPALNQARTTIPLTRYAANTGPKGVIADAQNFRDSRRQHRVSMRSGFNPPSEALSWREHEALSHSEKIADLSDQEDVEDDDFMQQWRMSRLKELQSGAHDNKAYNGQRKSRIWGGLTTVDGNGYLNAVDHSPVETVVIVYIYDDESEVSVYIEECIRTLAQKHLDVRFVKMHFEDAEMEPAGVPALLAYRGGDKFAGLVPIIQDIPDDAELSASTLESVLKRHQILQ